MAYARRDVVGGAVATTLSSGISSGDTSFTIATTTGWPTGSNGDFFVVISRGTASEEKIRCASRTSGSITVQTSGRGSDGTSAIAHDSGEPVEHCITAIDADEANYAVAQTVGKVTTQGDIIVGSAANTFARLAKGTSGLPLVAGASTLSYSTLGASALATDSVGSAQIAADSVGSSELAPAGVTETELATSVAGAGLTGGAGTALAVNPDGTTLEINTDAVRVKDAGIGLAKFAATVRPIILATSAPSSTPGDFWWDTDNYALYEYTTATTSWQAPWNLPWGRVAGATATSAQTGITTLTNLTGLSVTFTALANRYYKVTGFVQFKNTASTPALQQLVIADGSNNILGRMITNLGVGSNSQGALVIAEDLELSGSSTLKLRFGRSAGDAATYATESDLLAGYIRVEDIGPSGNPA